MTDKLFIIGNGFDIHHGLKTSYADFREYIMKKKRFLYEALLEVYGDAPEQIEWWWNFEEMLGYIDYKNIANLKNGEALGFMRVKSLLKGKLPPLFGTWIESINDNIELEEELGIESDAFFFTFNYTMILEKYYHINEDNVWHIHNSIKDFKKGENPIVGHDSSRSELFKQLIKSREQNPSIRPDISNAIMEEVLNGAKDVNGNIYRSVKEHKFDQYANIKHFVVMGFSFNNIDLPYINEIVKVNSSIDDADWTLYCYKDGEYERMTNQLLSIGIRKEKILSPKSW